MENQDGKSYHILTYIFSYFRCIWRKL